jgi:hypothetical protein
MKGAARVVSMGLLLALGVNGLVLPVGATVGEARLLVGVNYFGGVVARKA